MKTIPSGNMDHIALLRASHTNTDARNFVRETPANVHTIPINDADFQPEKFRPDYYDGIIITGSKASVHDNQEWITQAENIVKQSVEEYEIPTLGICWGNQLLAHALGGTVETKQKRELGFTKVAKTDNQHPIFWGIKNEFTAFQSHTDYVTQIPDNATLLAKNKHANQAFSYKSAIGLQFHPEVDYRTAVDLVNKYKHKETVPPTPDTSIESLQLAKETTDVLRNFTHRIIR